MLDYLRAKVAEYAIVLSWLDRQTQVLEPLLPEHSHLIARLQKKLAEAQTQHGRLRALVRSSHSRLIRRALPIVHDIDLWIAIISYYYLPALQKEGEADLALRKLLLSLASRCGLSWVEDIAVRLDGAHATVSVIPETPVVFAPPQHAASLLDMPGLYHELGHNVFRRFPSIADTLVAEVSAYFTAFRQNVGPMAPGQKAERDRAINNALEYWHMRRLDELFCDIFGTFVCGPAHYFSCVDMGVRLGSDPFHVDLEDEHPPLSARVYACYGSLAPAHQSEHVVISAHGVWNTHLGAHARNAEFELVCATALLDRLVEAAIRKIEELLPNTPRYDEPLPSDEEIEQIHPDASMENILNRVAVILQTQPERYADWEVKAYSQLRSYNSKS
jgi:hypothetical protein